MAFLHTNLSGVLVIGRRVPSSSIEIACGDAELLDDLVLRLAPGRIIPGHRELPWDDRVLARSASIAAFRERVAAELKTLRPKLEKTR